MTDKKYRYTCKIRCYNDDEYDGHLRYFISEIYLNNKISDDDINKIIENTNFNDDIFKFDNNIFLSIFQTNDYFLKIKHTTFI